MKWEGAIELLFRFARDLRRPVGVCALEFQGVWPPRHDRVLPNDRHASSCDRSAIRADANAYRLTTFADGPDDPSNPQYPRPTLFQAVRHPVVGWNFVAG